VKIDTELERLLQRALDKKNRQYPICAAFMVGGNLDGQFLPFRDPPPPEFKGMRDHYELESYDHKVAVYTVVAS
jgi:hypothetical protein